MGLPNPGMDFTAFDTLPAASLDELVENIEALQDGTAFDSSTSLPANTLSNPYKFHAYRSGAWTMTTNVQTIVPLNAELFDTNSNFNTSTYQYTVPMTGFYYFNGSVRMATISAAGVGSYIVKNGSIAIAGHSGVPTGYTGGFSTAMLVSGLVSCTAGDLIEMQYYGAAHTGDAGANATFFQGFLVSKT